MRTIYHIKRLSFTAFAWAVIPPLLTNTFFFLLSPNEISLTQWLLALALLQIPWLAYCNWGRKSDELLPVFAIISFMYWLYYAVSLFWGARTVSGGENLNERNVSDESITSALLLCALGVSFLWLGMRTRLSRYLVPKELPQLTKG